MAALRGKKVIAYHEASHAVVGRTLGAEVPWVDLISATAPHRSLAHLARELDVQTQIAAHETDAKICFAGAQGQVQYCASVGQAMTRGQKNKAQSTDWVDDWRNATSSAATAVALRHGQEPMPGAALDTAYHDEALHLANKLLRGAAMHVEQNWPAIERVARALLERKRLTQDELDALITNGLGEARHCPAERSRDPGSARTSS